MIQFPAYIMMQDSMFQHKGTRWNGWIVLTTLLAFGLRLIWLGRPSLWYDEAFSQVVAQVDWPTFWSALLADAVHPPGYYLLLRGAVRLWGDSEFGLRWPSVLAGTLAVPLLGRLGRILGSQGWGLAAGLWLALSPFAIWYAQEARMYSLLLCLTLGSAYAFWRLLKQPNWKRWGGVAAISAISFTIHYFAFIFSLVQFAYLALNLRRTHQALRWWALAQVVAVIPFLPWAWVVARREGGYFGIGWIQPVTPRDLLVTVSNLAFTLGDPRSIWTWLGLVVMVGVVIAGALTLRASAARSFLLLWLWLPLLFIWFISLWLPLYVDRYFIICLPALLLLSSALTLSPLKIAYGTIIGLLLLTGIASAHIWRELIWVKEDWRSAASLIQQHEQPGDALVMREFQNVIPFNYYYRGSLTAQIVEINRQVTPLEALLTGRKRLWLVYRRPFASTHGLAGSQPFTWQDDEQPLLRAWLLAHEAQLLQTITLPGVYVVLYEL